MKINAKTSSVTRANYVGFLAAASANALASAAVSPALSLLSPYLEPIRDLVNTIPKTTAEDILAGFENGVDVNPLAGLNKITAIGYINEFRRAVGLGKNEPKAFVKQSRAIAKSEKTVLRSLQRTFTGPLMARTTF